MQSLAREAIDNIAARDRVPIVVGGSVPAIQEITLGFSRAENPDLKKWLAAATEDELRDFCKDWGQSQFFEYDNPVEAIRRKLYSTHTTETLNPLPNVYPIGIRHDTNRLIKRIQDRLDQMWDEGLPEEVERLVDRYGWVGPLSEAIGYKEFMPGPDGQKPDPNKVHRAILANTIGFVWSQSQEFGDMTPVRWAKSPEHAIEIGRWVIDQYQTNGLQAAQTFSYPYTLNGESR
jgi:tRNA dimethylallyltransferase